MREGWCAAAKPQSESRALSRDWFDACAAQAWDSWQDCDALVYRLRVRQKNSRPSTCLSPCSWLRFLASVSWSRLPLLYRATRSSNQPDPLPDLHSKLVAYDSPDPKPPSHFSAEQAQEPMKPAPTHSHAPRLRCS